MNQDLVFLLSTFLSPFDVIRLGSTCKALRKRFLQNSNVWRRQIEVCLGACLTSKKLRSVDFMKRWRKLKRLPRSDPIRVFVLGSPSSGKSELASKGGSFVGEQVTVLCKRLCLPFVSTELLEKRNADSVRTKIDSDNQGEFCECASPTLWVCRHACCGLFRLERSEFLGQGN